MNRWLSLTWGDIATLEYGKGLRDYQDEIGTTPVYGTNGQIGWTEEEPLCNEPAVIIGRKGAYRGVHYSSAPFYVIDTAFYLKARSDAPVNYDPKWAYYQLLTVDINSMDSGSAIPSTSRDDFYALSLSIPPINEQKRIAEILSHFDDKIKLNRQMNTTLEAIARAIFKSWFVDFDPVYAKADGREPVGMDAETAALFPDSFEESELGLIPAGWGVSRLANSIEVNPRRNIIRDRPLPYLPMSHVSETLSRPLEIEEREYKSGTRFINGDTLMARITPSLENGKTCYVDFLEDDKQIGYGSTEFNVLRSKAPFPLEYTYFLARSNELRVEAILSMTGTSGRQRVQTEVIEDFLITLPPPEILSVFGKFARGILTMTKANDSQSHTLAELRDTLLPRLISGDLRLSSSLMFD